MNLLFVVISQVVCHVFIETNKPYVLVHDDYIAIKRHVKQGIKFVKYASIYQRESSNSMFKKIIQKLRFGSSKTKISADVNSFKESEKKQEDLTK